MQFLKGEGATLSKYSEDNLCKECRERERDSPVGESQVSTGPESERTVLPSSAQGRIQRLRHELVLQVFMRRGSLWEAISNVRNRWNIEPKVQIPPSGRGWQMPEDAPDSADIVKYSEYAKRWQEEISAIKEKVAPEPCLPTEGLFDWELERSWNDFLSACVLYDPPSGQLLEFASYNNPESSYLPDSQFPYRGNTKKRPEMIAPPIKTLAELMWAGDWYWHRILDYIRKHYQLHYVSNRYDDKDEQPLLHPLAQPEDVAELVEDATLIIPGLNKEYREKYDQHSQRYYIEVNEYTTLDDVKNAYRMIRAGQKERPKKRRERDQLTAVQCAVLYDRHNPVDPKDKRQRRWTYQKLAEHFSLDSPRAAEYHVKLGKKILSGEDSDEI